MTSREFCYWLQGLFELGKSPEGLSCAQVECVKKHLALVFVHEIDPSYGPAEHQATLSAIHNNVMTPDQLEELKDRIKKLEERPPQKVVHHSSGGSGLIRC
jgi:hypothetical protein